MISQKVEALGPFAVLDFLRNLVGRVESGEVVINVCEFHTDPAVSAFRVTLDATSVSTLNRRRATPKPVPGWAFDGIAPLNVLDVDEFEAEKPQKQRPQKAKPQKAKPQKAKPRPFGARELDLD